MRPCWPYRSRCRRSLSPLMADPDPAAVAAEVESRIGMLASPSTAAIRRVRAAVSKEFRDWRGDQVLEVALQIQGDHRWVAYELVYHHSGAMALIHQDTVLRLAGDLESWGTVDAFCRYIAGPAWQRGQLDDETVLAWASAPDRWWRRAALVATVPLNLRAAGGTGDRDRTITICRHLVDDRDDMVVKALSWALRELIVWDPAAVKNFVDDHSERLAPRVRREVLNKLNTGLKDPRRSR